MDEFEVERVLDHRRVHYGRVWVDGYLVKWVGYGVFEATWEPSTHLANAPTALAEYFGHSGWASHEDTRLPRGGVMLGFVVWFCLLLYAVLSL